MPNDYVGSFLRGLAGPLTGGPAQQRIQQRKTQGMLSEEQRLRMAAGPYATQVDKYVRDAVGLTEDQRKREKKKLEAVLSTAGLLYLNHMEGRLGEAPLLTMETWGAPAAGKAAVMGAWGGTRPGFPEELGIGQLPAEGREAEIQKRFADIERQYPGATEIGMGLLGGLGAEGVLTPEQAAIQRAREKPGAMEEITDITKGWPGRTVGEKRTDVEIALKTGTLSELAASAIKAMPIYTEVPVWVSEMEDAMLPSFGFKKVKGEVKGDLSTDLKTRTGQLTLREIYRIDTTALPDLASYSESEQDKMRMLAFGVEMMDMSDRALLEANQLERLGFSTEFAKLVKNPLIKYVITEDKAIKAEFPNAVLSLLPWLTKEQIAKLMTLVYDPMVVGNIQRTRELK